MFKVLSLEYKINIQKKSLMTKVNNINCSKESLKCDLISLVEGLKTYFVTIKCCSYSFPKIYVKENMYISVFISWNIWLFVPQTVLNFDLMSWGFHYLIFQFNAYIHSKDTNTIKKTTRHRNWKFQKTCIDFSIRNVRPANGILISKAEISTLNKKVLKITTKSV